MTGTEAVAQVRSRRGKEDCFIKWWRNHDDFVEFELIDQFLGRVAADGIVDGFELYDLAGMWRLFLDLNPDQLALVTSEGTELIQWTWRDAEGRERLSSYPFTPLGLKSLMDEEFFA